MRCQTCDCIYVPDSASGFGECRESPPKVFPVPVSTIQGQSIGFQSVFPRVPLDCWCSQHSDCVNAEEGHVKVITS